jgi:phytoene/squalene synthetase
MKELFDLISLKSSKLTTVSYSTSFSMGIRVFSKKFQYPIYDIYGFVRFADEIVDTFHEYDKEKLFVKFKDDTKTAIREGISLNPILNSFQMIVNRYNIDMELIDVFLKSMEMDLFKKEYDESGYEEYILGSAQVVGLMCLRIFCEGRGACYEELKDPAMKLGSAYQKINFLRDVKADYHQLGRTYFPEVNLDNFDNKTKKEIEQDIDKDFKAGLEGIRRLPKGSKFGVYLSYVYYYSLFRRIKRRSSETLMKKRVRVPDSMKMLLLVLTYFRVKLNRIV